MFTPHTLSLSLVSRQSSVITVLGNVSYGVQQIDADRDCLLASTFLFRMRLASQYNLENVPEPFHRYSPWWIFRSQEVQPRRLTNLNPAK